MAYQSPEQQFGAMQQQAQGDYQTWKSQDAATRAKIAELRKQRDALRSSTGTVFNADSAKWNQLNDEANALAMTTGTYQGVDPNYFDPSKSPDAAFKRMTSLGEDRLASVSNDTTDAMLMAELQKRITGGDVPYSQQAINAYQTAAGEQASAAEQANNQQIMEQMAARGFSANDPALQAAQRQQQQARQQAAQAANLNINQQASQANYNAKGQAMQQASAQQAQKAAQIAQAQAALNQTYNQVTNNDLKSQIPSFNQTLKSTQPTMQKTGMGGWYQYK